MKITFKSILIGLGAVLGIVGFIMMFLSPLTLAPNLDPTVKGILNEILDFNNGELAWKEFYFGTADSEGYIVPAIGFIMMVVGAVLALVVAALSNKPGNNIAILILGVVVAAVFAVGGILALCAKTVVLNDIQVAVDKLPDINGSNAALMGKFNELLKLGTGPLVGGILGIAAALLTGIGAVLPGPRKAKKGKRK